MSHRGDLPTCITAPYPQPAPHLLALPAAAPPQCRNGLRYYSPTGIPSHTAHRIKSRGKKGEQEGQCKLAHSPASDVEKGHTSRRALTGDVQEGVFEDWHLRSGSIGARALNPITAGPLPATLLGTLVSHPSIDPNHCVVVNILQRPLDRSGLVHPRTDDRA